jgi:hypothetical protein
LEAQTIHESEMALFSECMQWCARKTIDTADIVRDGDVTPTIGPERTIPSLSGGAMGLRKRQALRTPDLSHLRGSVEPMYHRLSL